MATTAAGVPRRALAAAGLTVALSAVTACGDRSTDVVAVDVAATPCDTPNRDRGGGVVVGEDLVVTAAHLVEGPRRSIEVDGRTANVVALDVRTDLALLATDTADASPRIGRDAVAGPATLRSVGGDHDVEVSETGTLVVEDVTDGTRARREVHTFTPAVDAGASGSPLVDADGRLIGVVVLANRTDDTSYASTADEIDALLALEGDPPARPPCPG